MGDWLGTGTIAPFLRQYRSFEDARRFARALKLGSSADWKKYCEGKKRNKPKLPSDIPRAPWSTYKGKGWKGMGDWLGTGNVASSEYRFRTFREARAYTHRLRLKGRTDWKKVCAGRKDGKSKLPSDIPTNPNLTYRDKGWSGWGDWLGTGTLAPSDRRYRSFANARKYARSLRLKTRSDWRLFCGGDIKRRGKLPADVPAAPHYVYASKGWKNYSDWLGFDRKRKVKRRR